MADLINDDMLSALEVYYGKFGDYDSLDWGESAFFVKKWRSGHVRSVLADCLASIFYNWSSTWRCGSILFLKILEVSFYFRNDVPFKSFSSPRVSLSCKTQVSRRIRESILQNRHMASHSLGGQWLLPPGLREGMGSLWPSSRRYLSV